MTRLRFIKRNSILWTYLPSDLLELISDGEILLDNIQDHYTTKRITDYSFLVFPFAKAYEGFLKKLFLDLGVIKYDDYYGDEIRIGRILNPHYQHESDNVFARICSDLAGNGSDSELPERLWLVWTQGRNLLFHYYPHNYKRLTYDEAVKIIKSIVNAMETSIHACKLKHKIN